MLNILYLEDNLGDYFLIEEYLYESFDELSITHCTSYAQAEEKLSSENTFTVILLDVHLSDSIGLELITSVLQHAHKTPVIILTGFSDKDLLEQSRALGISDFLIKDDLTMETLQQSILSATVK